MLMSLLPGFRELRTPLVAGYIWIATLWLGLPALGVQPDLITKPTTEPLATIWTGGRLLGPAVCIAVLTFSAYLLGSFLEVSPESRAARTTAIAVGAERPVRLLVATDPAQAALAADLSLADQRLRAALSTRASRDLFLHISREVDLEIDPLRPSARGIQLADAVLDEMPQLVTRLLVSSRELYDRYDRFIAESTLRLNVGIPLAALITVLALRSDRHGLAVLLALSAGLVVCLLLMRQGTQRAVAARDVVVQALTIPEIDLSSRQLAEEVRRAELPDLLVEEDTKVASQNVIRLRLAALALGLSDVQLSLATGANLVALTIVRFTDNISPNLPIATLGLGVISVILGTASAWLAGLRNARPAVMSALFTASGAVLAAFSLSRVPL